MHSLGGASRRRSCARAAGGEGEAPCVLTRRGLGGALAAAAFAPAAAATAAAPGTDILTRTVMTAQEDGSVGIRLVDVEYAPNGNAAAALLRVGGERAAADPVGVVAFREFEAADGAIAVGERVMRGKLLSTYFREQEAAAAAKKARKQAQRDGGGGHGDGRRSSSQRSRTLLRDVHSAPPCTAARRVRRRRTRRTSPSAVVCGSSSAQEWQCSQP